MSQGSGDGGKPIEVSPVARAGAHGQLVTGGPCRAGVQRARAAPLAEIWMSWSPVRLAGGLCRERHAKGHRWLQKSPGLGASEGPAGYYSHSFHMAIEQEPELGVKPVEGCK